MGTENKEIKSSSDYSVSDHNKLVFEQWKYELNKSNLKAKITIGISDEGMASVFVNSSVSPDHAAQILMQMANGLINKNAKIIHHTEDDIRESLPHLFKKKY